MCQPPLWNVWEQIGLVNYEQTFRLNWFFVLARRLGHKLACQYEKMFPFDPT